MSVVSVTFLIFLLVSALIFYIIPPKFRWIVLLIASLVFYCVAGSLAFIPFIVITSLIIWAGGLVIEGFDLKLKDELSAADLNHEDKKSIRKKWKKKSKAVLIGCFILCVGCLVFVKFANVAASLISLLSGADTVSISWIIVPLGISYYTLSVVGYILDVYWKRGEAEKNFFRFLLYTVYFPRILQGPIARYSKSGQALKAELRFDSRRIAFGLELMIWGFFKKLVIADRINVLVSNVFDGNVHSGSIFLLSIFLEAIMMYADFSGYMDIVSGASQIFGVELELNFKNPFFSKTVPEFWRRWHISMGTWFKDYVYYPITVSGWAKSLNKKAKKNVSKRFARVVAVAPACIITWLLTGLWHEASPVYILWGLYYGVLITLSVSLEPFFTAVNRFLKINEESFMWRLFRMFRTFLIFVFGDFLTNAGSLSNMGFVLKNIFANFRIWQWFDGTVYTLGIGEKEMLILAVSLIILWIVEMMQERFCVREKLAGQNIVVRWVIIYAAIFAIIIFGVYGIGFDAASFIYMQF